MIDDEFRFLHISDLHLCQEMSRRNALSLLSLSPSRYIDVAKSVYKNGPRSLLRPTSYNGPSLSALSEFVYKRQNAYEAILISGDIATSGTAIDHAVAFSYVDAPAVAKWRDRDGRPVLSQLKTPVVVCPGNHDNYTGNKPNPSNVNFALKFGRYLPKYDKNNVGHAIFVGENSALAVIYADFGFLTSSDANNRLHLYGGGRVHNHVINELVARTVKFRASKALTQKRRDVIWMLHFAPFQCGSSLELIDWQKVIQTADKNDVVNIICGHTHDQSDHRYGKVNVYCAGSAIAVDAPNKIHDLTFNDNSRSITRLDYQWFDASASFNLVP